MYHALSLEDMLDLVNATQCFANRLSPAQRRQVADWPKRASTLHAWLLTMCHPDGEISMFNDAAFGIAPRVAELDGYARRVLVDVAPVGPDYLPGHAHADTLSFELSVGAQRVLVNSGTSCYGSSPERLRQRGTAAHNTVVVNGQDSSEVWGGFRVARRAYPLGLSIQQSADATATEVRCAHNGYVRLAGKPIHQRTWRLDAHGLTVTDLVEGPHQCAEARFHFHPLVQLQMGSNQTGGTATLPDGRVLTWRQDKGQARLEASTWDPRFGHVESNMCLVVNLLDGYSNIDFN